MNPGPGDGQQLPKERLAQGAPGQLWDGGSFCCPLPCVLGKHLHGSDQTHLLKCRFQDSYIPRAIISAVGTQGSDLQRTPG